MFVGAGTVLTIDQVDRAVNAGAKFIVSPGFDPEIVDYCLEKNIPVFPGCITPSEVAQAVKRAHIRRGHRFDRRHPAELLCREKLHYLQPQLNSLLNVGGAAENGGTFCVSVWYAGESRERICLCRDGGGSDESAFQRKMRSYCYQDKLYRKGRKLYEHGSGGRV